jgi:hypothetical protein
MKLPPGRSAALSTSGRLRQRIASALLVLGVAVGALVRLVREYAPPGAVAFPHQRPAVTRFTNASSVDGLGIHSEYWH